MKALQRVLSIVFILQAGAVFGAAAEAPGLKPIALDDPAIQDLQAQLERELAAQQYGDALATADKVVALVKEQGNENDTWVYAARENRALVQLHSGDTEGAIAAYQRIVDDIGQSGNYRDRRLAGPLFGLGVAFHQVGDYARAIESLEQAIFITRTNKGLESLEQIRHDAVLMDCYLNTGQFERAQDRLEARLNIARQAIDRGPELEQELAEAARWYRVLNDSYRESRLHEERVDILTEALGENHPDLVPVYYDLAESYGREMHEDIDRIRDIKEAERRVSYSVVRSNQLQRSMSYEFGGGPTGERDLLDAEWKAVRALRQALRIEEEREDATPARIANAYTRLGDHYQLIGNSRKARRYYKRAYDLLSENGLNEQLAALFGEPVPLYRRSMKLPAPDDPEDLKAYRGEIEMLLDVTSRGEARNIEVVSVRPEAAKVFEDKALRYSRDTIFRPRLTEEGIVTTEKMRYVYPLQPAYKRP